jgi:hypothetical protein
MAPFFHYPLQPLYVLQSRHFGSAMVIASYLRWQLRLYRSKTFGSGLTNRFDASFAPFQTYTEKWGVVQ